MFQVKPQGGFVGLTIPFMILIVIDYPTIQYGFFLFGHVQNLGPETFALNLGT
ncbi:hypothetical protein [Flagellimonas myxillae]|uniref:hypothetical protein n=1 Tax=Flagellimonas myxillae TaxID=2942214 RepID=UPI002FF8BE47